jgi:hypothetical protein
MQWDAIDADEAERVRAFDEESFVEWLETRDGDSFDVDKAWHAVHFTLTGDAWSTDGPLGQVVLGGEPFGEDIGYGPARWMPPDAVAAIAERLTALRPEEFEQRLDFAALAANDIYPSIWDRDPATDQLVEFVRGAYETLRDRYARAARAGQGFVISLL